MMSAWDRLLGSINPSVLVALAAAVGAFAGNFLKDLLPSLALESWKSRREFAAVFRRYRDPIVLSAIELAHRLEEIEREYPPSFLNSYDRRATSAEREPGIARDDYYDRYKFDSSTYRLCAFLGWVELYRQDIVFLSSGEGRVDSDIDQALKRIRAALADGHLNRADDWKTWRDALIFREEQRAIGESMIAAREGGRVIVGYGAFCSLVDSQGAKRWITIAERFLSDLEGERDFRRFRLRLLAVGLVDLIERLEKSRLSPRLKNLRSEAKAYIETNGDRAALSDSVRESRELLPADGRPNA